VNHAGGLRRHHFDYGKCFRNVGEGHPEKGSLNFFAFL
jgi:hypothetical protein